MKRLFASVSARWKRLFELSARAALVVVILASRPFLFCLVGRGIGWIIGLRLRHELGKECPWCL